MHGIALQAILQPDGRCLGHEILIRRRAAAGTWELPGDFLTRPPGISAQRWLADMYVIERIWQDDRLRQMPGLLFINVSRATLEQDESYQLWLAVLRRVARARASGIIVEISEEAGMPLDLLAGRVAGIRAAGVATAMDDFGTGCHRLRLLREPFWDWVKVWWPVCSLEENELGKAASICHARSVPMIMEGIEQEADMERAKAFRPRGLQGLMVAPPRIFHPAPDDFEGGVHDEDRGAAGHGRMLSRAEREG